MITLFLNDHRLLWNPNGATPYRRKSTPPILTRHLYHHTPLIEYIQKHLYMYPRTLLFGSWDITQPYHRPYAHICMHMHSYGYTCVHMHADARPLPHPRLTLHAYACPLKTHSMHSIHLHAGACMCMQLDAAGLGYAPYCVFQQGL